MTPVLEGYKTPDGSLHNNNVTVQTQNRFNSNMILVLSRVFTQSVMEDIPNTSTRTEEGSSDATTTTISISKSVFLPAESDGVDKETGGGGIVVNPQDMGLTSSTQAMTTKLPPPPTATPVTDNLTEFSVWTEDFWNSSSSPSSSSTSSLSLLVTTNISVVNETNASIVTTLIPDEGDVSCVEWEAAQHNLFQTANLFFAAAFIVPRSFKQSLLLLR